MTLSAFFRITSDSLPTLLQKSSEMTSKFPTVLQNTSKGCVLILHPSPKVYTLYTLSCMDLTPQKWWKLPPPNAYTNPFKSHKGWVANGRSETDREFIHSLIHGGVCVHSVHFRKRVENWDIAIVPAQSIL